MKPPSLSVFAPAKINLFLHVTGRRPDGYHTLDSLVAFADIGDRVTVTPAADFSFAIQGPYAGAFQAAARDAGPQSANLAVRAARGLAQLAGRPLQARVTLLKNLPLASGLGGGSADAAAVLWALLDWWEIEAATLPGFDDLLMRLGADVPSCFSCRPSWLGGAGEALDDAENLPEVPVVLVNPGPACPTAAVFKKFQLPYAEHGAAIAFDGTVDELVDFLRARDNMLTAAAVEIVPDIAFALDALQMQNGCRLARMSGSGATCFGLFGDADGALSAAETILARHPQWWVRAGTLNRPERY